MDWTGLNWNWTQQAKPDSVTFLRRKVMFHVLFVWCVCVCVLYEDEDDDGNGDGFSDDDDGQRDLTVKR
jgi:hypothetical protein